MAMTLKQARRHREKTQKEMADLLKVHLQTYRKIERTPEVATVQQAKEMAAYLDVSYNDIFFGADSILNR